MVWVWFLTLLMLLLPRPLMLPMLRPLLRLRLARGLLLLLLGGWWLACGWWLVCWLAGSLAG